MHSLSPLLVQWLLAAMPQPVEATPWTLEWSAPAECPTAAEVDGTVSRWHAQAPSDVATSGVRARASVLRRDDGTFALQLEIEAAEVVTSHAVEATDCRSLADATALQIAMALGIDLSAPDVTTVPAPRAAEDATTAPVASPTTTTTTTTSSPGAPPPSAPTDNARNRRIPRGVLRVQGSVGTGRVPRLDGRLALAGGVVWPRARIEIAVGHTFEQRARHPERSDLAIRVWQWTAVARGCWTPHLGRIELPVCGGLEAGVSQGHAVGVPRRRTATNPFVAAVASVGVAWPFTRRFALWVAVDGWVAMTQPAFTIETLTPWFVTRRGGVDGVVGLEVRFP